MPLPNLIDVLKVTPMKKVIKAAKTEEKVKELTKKDEVVKQRPASEVRKKLYGEKK